MDTTISAKKRIKKSKARNKRTVRKYLFVLSLIIIPLINFAVFWVYMNFDTILLTFKRFDVPTASYVWR